MHSTCDGSAIDANLRRQPIEDRKTALAKLLRNAKPGLQLNEHISEPGDMTEGPWAIAGVVAAIVVLGITGYDIFVRSIWRRFRLRNPCEVHFAIRPLQQATLDYIFQDDQGHRVKELAVPANQLVEIEIGYEPKIAFYEAELILGCDGDGATKPFATECINRLIAVGKSHWIPGEDEGHWRDRHKYYHVLRNKPRAVMHPVHIPQMFHSLQMKWPGL